MKKGQIIEGVSERFDFPNKGIVTCEEGVCIVKNALPGQKVRASVNKSRNGRCEGRLLEVLAPSPLETEPPCPHFGSCGGCTYLSFPYEESLAIKEGQVRRLLAPALASQERTCQFEEIKGSPAVFGYRNKMEFTFGDEVKDGPLALGMHRRGSFYDIVSVTDCRIVDEDYRKILCCVRDYFDELRGQGIPVSFYHRLRHTGYLRHLVVRKAAKTGEILAALVTTTQWPGREADKDGPLEREAAERQVAYTDEQEILGALKRRLLALPITGEIVGILHVKNDSLADVVQSDETEVLYGRDFFYEELLGLKFRVSLFSFFQTNSLGAELLYRTARDYISDYILPSDKIVYDLYSGTGTIAQMLAPVAEKVIGVELVEEAVLVAKENATLNGLHNCEFIAGDVLKVLDEIAEKPDVIVLDPPRDGVHPKALQKIIAYGVEHILYISCKASSLARDLAVFIERGYEAVRCVPIDQFPWTTGVETVVLLSKGEIDSKKVRVEFSLEDMDMSGFQKGATYQEIKEYVKEQTGLSVSNLYIAQVKRKCGLEVGQNYNLSKKENARVPQCPPEKEKAIRAALKHFHMV